MPYAVTCRSCGARFSVADDLVHKKLSGKVVTLRCKRCHEPIRVNASEPPGRGSSRPPAPAARSPLPQGPARAKPRPPLKTRPTSTVMGLGPRKPPPRNLRREQEERAKGGVSHDLFDASPPPPDGSSYVDLSDMAHSEPPGALSSAPSANSASSAPPLFDLAHAERHPLSRAEEDVDFLLGLTGSPGTAATLASPSLSDLARKAPSEPPPSAPKPREADVSTPRPRATAKTIASAPSAAPTLEPERAKKRSGFGLMLGLAAIGAAALGVSLTQKQPEPAAARPPPAVPAATSEPELKPASPEPVVAAPTTSAVTSAEPAPPAAHGASAAAQVARAANANVSAKAVHTDDAGSLTTAATSQAPTATPKAAIAPKPEPAAAGTPFDRNAAASALAGAAAQASACRKDGDPSGVANVTLTFAPSGRVTTAKLSGPPFAGTATGGCIASTLRRAKIPPYDGDLVTVAKTIVVQ